jgi:hypothetical protein
LSTINSTINSRRRNTEKRRSLFREPVKEVDKRGKKKDGRTKTEDAKEKEVAKKECG